METQVPQDSLHFLVNKELQDSQEELGLLDNLDPQVQRVLLVTEVLLGRVVSQGI